MPDEIDWAITTWEGNRRRQHAEFRALSLREKLTIIEQMGEVGERFARQRADRQPAASARRASRIEVPQPASRTTGDAPHGGDGGLTGN